MTVIQVGRAISGDGSIQFLAAIKGSHWHDVTKSFPSWNKLLASVTNEDFAQVLGSHQQVAGQDQKFAIPFDESTRFYGVALNYESRAEQVGVSLPETPFVFTKEYSSLLAVGEPVRLPRNLQAHLEGEVGIVLSRELDDGDWAFGRVAINDMTFPERLGPPPGDNWFDGKNLHSTTTLGPWVEVEVEVSVNTFENSLRTWRNSSLCQAATGSDMHFTAAEVLSHLRERVSLSPGDVISLGSPRNDIDGLGQHPLHDGDFVTIIVDDLPAASFTVEWLN